MRFEWLERRREYGLFFIRLIVGFHLAYGTADNVFSSARVDRVLHSRSGKTIVG